MKILYTSLILSILSLAAFGQSQRTVLHEEFTNASCPPCASQNPSYNALLDANADNSVNIKYQTAFPGYDPMNEHNPAEVQTRFDYYQDIEGVPTAIIDGEIPDVSPSYAGAPGAFTQQMMDDAAAVPASFDIDVEYTLTPDELSVSATATCTQDAEGNLRMRVAVVEREIIFASPPGSTNESEFFNVMKKMLPGASGLEMESAYAVGETFSTTQSWTYANVYNANQLAVIVFIQDDNTKEVLQAAMADGAELEPINDIDATSIAVEGLSNDECESIINPVVTIRNNGSEPLTSATLNYTINDATGSVEWTGNLDFYETEDVSLGEISFTQEADNTLEVTISEPNGDGVDMNEENNLIEVDAVLAGLVTDTEIEVHFYTDLFALESTWEIRNSAGDVVADGGPYTEGPLDFGGGGPDANTTMVHEVSLPNAQDCYEVRVLDSYGDGLQYGAGEGPGGSFGLEVFFEGNSVKFIELGDFGSTDITGGAIVAAGSLSLDENMFESLTIFPNPSVGQVNIEGTLLNPSETTISLHDVTGKLVYQEDLGNMPEGYFYKTLDLSSLVSGIYLININTGSSVTTKRVAISK